VWTVTTNYYRIIVDQHCRSESLKGVYSQGWNCRGVGGLNPQPSSCLQTLIFEWKSAKNFNPRARFQTFRQLPPPQFF